MKKIAIVTDDGRTISAHFGRAAYFMVITVQDGKVTGREQREKPVHQHGHDHEHRHEPPTLVTLQLDDALPASDARHTGMIEPIRDCQVAVARGMGRPVYDKLRAAGIEPITTNVREIDEAVRLYLAGELVDHPERLH